MQGKGGYKPRKGMGNRWHVIGDGDKPILILKKKDVPKLFTRLFWQVYDIWFYHHNGFAILPGGLSLGDLDPDIGKAVADMEMYYNQNFSLDVVMVKYQEAILKSLRALGGKKRRR